MSRGPVLHDYRPDTEASSSGSGRGNDHRHHLELMDSSSPAGAAGAPPGLKRKRSSAVIADAPADIRLAQHPQTASPSAAADATITPPTSHHPPLPSPSARTASPPAKRLNRNRSRSPPHGIGVGGSAEGSDARTSDPSPNGQQQQQQQQQRRHPAQHESAAGSNPWKIGASDASPSRSDSASGPAAAPHPPLSPSSSSSAAPLRSAPKFATGPHASDPKNIASAAESTASFEPAPTTVDTSTSPLAAAELTLALEPGITPPTSGIDRDIGSKGRMRVADVDAIQAPVSAQLPTAAIASEDDEDADAEGEDDPASADREVSTVCGHVPADAASAMPMVPAVKIEADESMSFASPSPATRQRKLAAVRAPSVSAERSAKSVAASPVPAAIMTLTSTSDNSLAASAPSTRATTPALHATPHSRRRKRERAANGSVTPRVPLPRLDSADRRRSGRIAKASSSHAAPSDPSSSSLSQLGARFGFSPFLEGLVLGTREPERRTRSGIRGARAAPGRSGATTKRGSKAKSVQLEKEASKDREDDGPSDDAKAELYLQLCILSHQLQAELEMVPFKTVEELRAEFLAPPSAPGPDEDAAIASVDRTGKLPDESAAWPPTPPPQFATARGQGPSRSTATTAATSRNASPTKARTSVPVQSRVETPPSSPEMPLMASLAQHRRQAETVDRPDPLPWVSQAWQDANPGPHNAGVEDSPVLRPSRPNIMSISALMSAPSPPRRRSTLTPARPAPWEWTQEDDMATEILRGLGMDPRGFSIPATNTDSSTAVTRSGTQTPAEPDVEVRPTSILDPHHMNVLSALDLDAIFAREEEEYAKEKEGCSELYAAMRYLAVYDEVVDRWRTSAVARLRKQMDMRKQEVARLLSAERDAAWMDFHDGQESLLIRDGAAKLAHARWQAESERNRISLRKPQSRAMAKVQRNLFVPGDSDAAKLPEGRRLYHQYGTFLQRGAHSSLQEPLLRADIDKIRKGVAGPSRPLSGQAGPGGIAGEEQEHDDDDEDADEEGSRLDVDADGDATSSSVGSESGISSLPSFTSVSSDDESSSESESGSEATPYHDDEGSAMDIDAATPSGKGAALMDHGHDAHAAAEAEQSHGSLKRQRRPPPPGVRWWKAGRPME
ncbi:uncharacterized protein PFL1_00967 [Pseudozyma flocculosa PF-1]|uniref:Uncharacterized protein n=1 Tax=Pseudozyma flocculosa TaxID=84751 RepID=A0A5C3F8E5_9BASI|nr:uncharacterized protein PFL1_00967 [Pseudozyma flocculosa PF-1]EPQ31634.1 hypothetical protein PFL1_00967 [Pseudozyma flocculosa PF-1]SPO40748.1 uncharacterized protein PSFLO_06230 [Pseudozyma flocculosa]